MEEKKKLPLPILIIVIGAVIGLVFAGIGFYKQNDAKKVNQERHDAAYKQALENKEILENKYAENAEKLKQLKSQYDAKSQECASLDMMDPNWFATNSACQNEVMNIQSQIDDIEMEQFEIENYDNTVYYDEVDPMSYNLFYIIGGSVFGLALLGAFIIYLVKGKKTYN